ncbi:MAG: hypothetical protein P0Y66_06705 [Candidatus Kaistia colombiensis]|nr:MAG: hypothetical protein P0Y66_06705 [Kaistia sp.]
MGVVETHGRSETQALVEGFEIIPRRTVDYQRPRARGDGSRRHPRPPPGAGPGRRTRPHQRRRQPSSQALSRRRGNLWRAASTSIRRSTSSMSKA